MEDHPHHSNPQKKPTPFKPQKFDHLSSSPFVLQMALKGSSIILSFFKNTAIPNPNIHDTKQAINPSLTQPEVQSAKEAKDKKEKSLIQNAEDPITTSHNPNLTNSSKSYPRPEMSQEEERIFKEQIEDVLKGIFGESFTKDEPISPSEMEESADPTPTMHPSMIHKAEIDLINEVLYRVEKGFLALMINDHEIFSQDMLLGLLQQIPNPADRIELLSNSLLSSFSHMAVTPEGDENVIHVLELSSPPQKILSDLPYLYLVKWRIFEDGVAIEKESEYALVSPVKKNGSSEVLPLYKYMEMIDFRQGQEEHDIQIEPSNRAFDPVNHRLIWGN